MRGDSKEAERVEVAEGGTHYQGLLCRHWTKAFPRGWNAWLILRIDLPLLAATESGDIVKEKVLEFPEQSVLRTILVYYR